MKELDLRQDIEKIVNQHLCRKAATLPLVDDECYCIGNTPRDSNMLEIYLSKSHKSKKKVQPCGNSLFVITTRYPIHAMKSLLHINFLKLSENEMQNSSINAKIYLFVKEHNLEKFVNNILNARKVGNTFIPSEYGNVVYTMLCDNSFFKNFNEYDTLSTISNLTNKEHPTIKFIPKTNIISKLITMPCISQNNNDSINSKINCTLH